MAKAGPLAGYNRLVTNGQITPDPAQAEATTWLQTLHDELVRYEKRGSFLSMFRRKADPRGIYICGDVGRGKSMLMDLFFETAPSALKRRVHFHAFMQEVHDAIKRWRDLPKAEQKAVLKARNIKGKPDDPIPPVAKEIADRATLLCFDEFQVSDVADAMILGRLFEQLFGFGTIIVATSNRPPHELYRDGINRQLFLPFIAMLQSQLDILRLDAATDYRQNRMLGAQVYFVGAANDTTPQLDQLWHDLAGKTDAAPCDLTVQGRKLTIAKCNGGIGRDSFDALCREALGPADYLAIADRFHTFFLDGVPQMTTDKRNEAKRFVTFIDALYEAKVKLVLSAEADPEALYPAGDGSFEFARTASRLTEMQSDDYLETPHRTQV